MLFQNRRPKVCLFSCFLAFLFSCFLAPCVFADGVGIPLVRPRPIAPKAPVMVVLEVAEDGNDFSVTGMPRTLDEKAYLFFTSTTIAADEEDEIPLTLYGASGKCRKFFAFGETQYGDRDFKKKGLRVIWRPSERGLRLLVISLYQRVRHDRLPNVLAQKFFLVNVGTIDTYMVGGKGDPVEITPMEPEELDGVTLRVRTALVRLPDLLAVPEPAKLISAGKVAPKIYMGNSGVVLLGPGEYYYTPANGETVRFWVAPWGCRKFWPEVSRDYGLPEGLEEELIWEDKKIGRRAKIFRRSDGSLKVFAIDKPFEWTFGAPDEKDTIWSFSSRRKIIIAHSGTVRFRFQPANAWRDPNFRIDMNYIDVDARESGKPLTVSAGPNGTKIYYSAPKGTRPLLVRAIHFYTPAHKESWDELYANGYVLEGLPQQGHLCFASDVGDRWYLIYKREGLHPWDLHKGKGAWQNYHEIYIQ